jgi:hypothetical protein
VLLYLPETLADDLGDLYDEFDARERLAGGSGVEKHADFMTELIQMALDHEDELAERLDIPSIDVD